MSDLDLVGLLEAGALDVSFAVLPVPRGPFEVVELFSEPYVVIVAAGSTLARVTRTLSMRRLAELPLVTAHRSRDTGQMEDHMWERGVQPNIVHRSDDNGTVEALVVAGFGVAVVPRLVAAAASDRVAVLELEEPLPLRRVGLAWRSDRKATLPEAFADTVRGACSELGLGP
jgi:DNA-binding transcriptional LysR family regulator